MKLALVILLVACSKSSGDDCQKVLEKSRTVMAEMGKSMGKPISAADETKLLDRCHDALAGGKREPAMDCILAAKDDDGVRACISGGLKGYRETGKKTEAKLHLNRIGKMVKMFYGETATFPAGKTALTPTTPCCKQGGTCAPNPADWSDPAWKALEMSIDEPYRFQYSYESDGKTSFTASATADLDCDGHPTTMSVHGSLENGNVRITDQD
jgi:hypothetical protein